MLYFGTQIKVYDFYFIIGISHCVFCVCDQVNYAIFNGSGLQCLRCAGKY